MHQNRTQNENIANILHLMKGMQGDMKSMQSEMKDMRGEITQLRKKCDDMHTEVSSDMKSGFADICNKQKYHDVMLKNQKWVYSAPRPPEEFWDSLEDDDA